MQHSVIAVIFVTH